MTSTVSATAKSLNPEYYYLWSTKVMMPISPQLETPESLTIKNPSSRGVVMEYILHPNSFMPVDKLIYQLILYTRLSLEPQVQVKASLSEQWLKPITAQTTPLVFLIGTENII